MSSGKKSEQALAPTFGFGDLSREEINTVLSQAGVSLFPPKKTPFATGIQRKRPQPQQQQQQQQQQQRSEQKLTAESASSVVPTMTTSSGLTATTPAPISNGTVKEKPLVNGTTSKPATTTTTTTATAEPATTTADASSVTASCPTTQQQPSPLSSKSPVSVAAETPKPKPTSWAALLKSNDAASKAKTAGGSGKSPLAGTPSPQQAKLSVNGGANAMLVQPPSAAAAAPTKFMGIADIINRYEARFDGPLLEPRGLINNVNTCFMNVILQPLSHCPPFYNLLKTIGQHVVHSFRSKTPLLDSMIEFMNEFRSEPAKNEEVKAEPYGEPFVPEYVYDALRGQKRFDSLKGRQEDAEEFLCFLLDGLHEEMVSVLKEKRKSEEAAAAAASTGNGWLEVGPGNKTSNLQLTGFDDSPISKIFGGKVRSTLRCPGAKDSANLEPFQSLPLDIQPDNVTTVEDAIRNMTVPEIMHDYMSPKGARVEATKQVYLETLPPVLILHMKRFVFDNVGGGVQKLQKPVQYGAELTIKQEWLTPVHRTNKPVTYKLFGIVYHHGASAGGGHYTCEVRRQNGMWLHVNDTNITPVSEQDVLMTEENTRTSETIHADQTAYILFYMRSS
ncbi:hypothetical protein BDB00DRAFT_877631 [Zychaea mexicana]|uniref:uncharacterized protein n=1 Tax=Zychaea mexicana TaxID=64656 RepID=UPI0022FDD869|nr:uncharacterized protein BDB00DRAFT_877631 [Zychaea mexicana]KAI9488245.1 hypothetical protein BDB00DRAFT_877631 [Zychaea mexicana]